MTRESIRRFFDEWMRRGRKDRKVDSFFGALERTKETDPVGWVEAKGDRNYSLHKWKKGFDRTQYFDPGNEHYAYVYGMLWEDDQGWNNNTTGDIFESIMGRRYLLETMQNEMTRAELVCQLIFCPPQISFLLEEWAR